jgi:signal transduction histidine kinase
MDQGDRTRLAQTISNILHNSDKFIGAGGTITVSLQEETAVKQVTSRCMAQESAWNRNSWRAFLSHSFRMTTVLIGARADSD